MPIFELNKEIVFPPVRLAEPNGILAVGGDLSPDRLLMAYRSGIFPWYSDDEPIIWWSPDPRFVLFPDELYISRTMRQVLKRRTFDITLDRDFRGVIRGCQGPRKKERGTWIRKNDGGIYQAPRPRFCAFRRGMAGRGEWPAPVWHITGSPLGIDVHPREQRVKGGLHLLVRKLNELGFVIIDESPVCAPSAEG